VRKAYGAVIMTNGAEENGRALIDEVEARIASVYRWDVAVKQAE
jgi:hypothetical protein